MTGPQGSEFNPAAGTIDFNADFDHAKLLELAKTRMPFGKHRGALLVDLPEPYVVWFAGKGFPQGKLGDMLRTVYEIKVNGLEYLFDRL